MPSIERKFIVDRGLLKIAVTQGGKVRSRGSSHQRDGHGPLRFKLADGGDGGFKVSTDWYIRQVIQRRHQSISKKEGFEFKNLYMLQMTKDKFTREYPNGLNHVNFQTKIYFK